MSTFGAGSTGTYIAAGVVAAGVAAGGYVYVSSQDGPVVAPETPVVAEAPVEVPVATPEPAPAPVDEMVTADPVPVPAEPVETAEIEPAAPVPPTFDVVRVDADGNALIAGLAAAGSEVFVYLGADEIAQTDADTGGNFVALATIEPSTEPQVVSLVMRADGVDTPSEATVIIAPRAVEVAEAPAPAPEVVAPDTNEEAPVVDAPVLDTPVEVAEPAPAPAPEPTPAPEVAPTVLIADNDGVRILQGGEETTPDEITIDAISYGDNGDAILTGRGDGDAVARVYLNNAITGETAIATSGDWTLALVDVDTGIYTLRVDQIDDTGAVTSRFETPFKREDPVVIAAAAAPEPAVSVKEPVAATPVPEAPVVETPVVEAPAVEAPVTETPQIETPQEAVTETAPPAAPAPRVTAITVQPGFTLWKIAKDAYGQGDLYVQVFDANKDTIANPDLIYPGQVFEVPSVSAE